MSEELNYLSYYGGCKELNFYYCAPMYAIKVMIGCRCECVPERLSLCVCDVCSMTELRQVQAKGNVRR